MFLFQSINLWYKSIFIIYNFSPPKSPEGDFAMRKVNL